MSHAATKWAFDQPEAFRDMKPSEWAVLMVLADCHNPVNGCFPSQDYICTKTNLAERAVRDQLARLRERKLIAWEASRANGKRGSNRYHLAFEVDFQPAEFAGSSTGEIEHQQPAESDTFNRQNLPPNPVREPVKEPIEREARAREQDPDPRPWERDKAFMRCLKAWWTQDGMANAWREWLTMEAEVRVSAERGIPIYLAKHQTRSSRCALSTYFHERPFQLYPQPTSTTEPAPATAELLPRSMAWCGVFFSLAMTPTLANVLRARSMLQDADFMRSTHVRCQDVPNAEALATLVKIKRDSDQFRAWRKTLGGRREGTLWLKPEAFGEWLWVPSEYPPAWVHGPPQGEAERSQELQTAEGEGAG